MTRTPKSPAKGKRIAADESVARFDVMVVSLLAWFKTAARVMPWRMTRDPYGIWVSEIMLQQTQVKTVIPYWERWMKALPGIADLAQADSALIHKLWEGLGYYTRVRNLQKAAQKIMTEHAGIFPRDHAMILELPGVGRYTAGAVASIAFNDAQPILDGNVIRVLTRWFGIAGNPRDKATNQELWSLAEKLVEQASKVKTHENACSHFNQSLMELGALICPPKQPSCLLCPIQKGCIAFKTGRVGELPNLGPRTVITARNFTAFVLEHDGKYLVQQRPADVVNAYLWEFPNWEADTSGKLDWPSEVERMLGVDWESYSELAVVKHAITRYKITLRAMGRSISVKERATIGKLLPQAVWLTNGELKKLAFSSAHQKIIMVAARLCDTVFNENKNAPNREKSGHSR